LLFCGNIKPALGGVGILERGWALAIFDFRKEPVFRGIATLITAGFPITVCNLRDCVLGVFLNGREFGFGGDDRVNDNSDLAMAGAGNTRGRWLYRAGLFHCTYSRFGDSFFSHIRFYQTCISRTLQDGYVFA
jgi:hypothetical protein